MNADLRLYTAPPSNAQIEATRKRQDWRLLLTLASLTACVALSAIIVFNFWDAHPDQHSLYELCLIGLGLLAAMSIWRLSRVFSGMHQAAQAHPETARALLACANSTAVKSYCKAVIRQGRCLSMEEAYMLTGQCKTEEEVLKLAAHYEAHGVWPTESFGG